MVWIYVDTNHRVGHPDHLKVFGLYLQTVFENGETARHGALAIFADLARDIASGLMLDPAWRLHLIDEMGKSVFEIAIVAKEVPSTDSEKMRQPFGAKPGFEGRFSWRDDLWPCRN